MTPRLREDLVAATVEEDGVVYVDLTDPATGVSFRFYDFEYELAKQLNGQSVEAVVAWASDVYQTEMTNAALDEFVEKLAGLGFLTVPGVVAQRKEPLPSSPFTASSHGAAEPERVEVASAPMFGELSGELAGEPFGELAGELSGVLPDDLPGDRSGDLFFGRSTPPIAAPGLTPAVSQMAFGRPASPFPAAGAGPPAAPPVAEAGAPEPRPREGSSGATASKPRTLTGLNLAPLTPMTAPGGADTAASPPVLPRLQSLGSPLPPLMADAVRGGGEVKRAPPRPGAAAASTAPPVPVPAPKPQSSPWPVIPSSTPASTPAKSSPSTKASPRVPVAPSPLPTDETPFASIAHAIVSEAEFPRGWPSLGEALEHSGPTPAMGSIIPPEALAGGGISEEEERGRERQKRKPASAPVTPPAKVSPSPAPLTPAASAPSAPAPAVGPAPAAAAAPAPVPVPVPVPASAAAPAAPVAAAAVPAAATPASPAATASAPGTAPASVPAAAASPPPPVVPPAATPEASAPAPIAASAWAAGMAGTSRASAAWVTALTDEVERPMVAERRQPPPPEVVVMPPLEPSAVPPVPKRRAPLIVGVAVLGAIVAGAILANREPAQSVPAPSLATPSVHVATPQPTTMYEWFATPGKVIPGRDDEVGFKVSGRLQDVMPPGTTFSAGEAVAHLQGSAARELIVNRIRSRVAFFEQLRDSSRAAGNEAAARQAEANLTARKRELADAQAKLSEMEIRSAMAGTIGEVLVQRGAPVRAGTPVFKIRAAGPRATFPFSAEDQAKARALGFCRVETVPGEPAGMGPGSPAGAPPPTPSGSAPTGAETASAGAGSAGAASEKPARVVDCSLPATTVAGAGAAAPPSPSALAVDLPAAAGVSPGTGVRLASARFDGVFPIPRQAVVHGATGTASAGNAHVWVVSEATQAVDSRAVELAPSSGELALVSRGLAAGDVVVIDPPADLAPGVQVNVLR